MQPEPADHRLRPTSTVKGQCEKHCPFAFSGLLRRLLAPQDRPFPFSFSISALSSDDCHAPGPARQTHARKLAPLLQAPTSIPAHGRQKGTPPSGKRTFSSVQFWDYCRFAQNLPAVFTLKPCSDAQYGELHAGAELELLERVLDVNSLFPRKCYKALEISRFEIPAVT